MEYQAKLNEKYMLVLHCISSFKGTTSRLKVIRYSYQFFYFLLFNISFYISRYPFFCNFLELHSTVSQKILVTKFPFLMDSPKTSLPQGCSNHLNLEMEAECQTKNLLYLNINISRKKC